MVAIAIWMAVMAILLMGVAPSVATIMKREREKELLFRGKQYARAISIFQRKYGRFPSELKDLYENRPRTIRKLFKDPMCNCMDWQLIIQGSPDAILNGVPGQGRPGITPTPSVFGKGPETKTVGPIIGVRSKIHEEALTDWRGMKFYDEWRFITGDADRDQMGTGIPGRPIPGMPPGPPVPVPRGR
jgi:type II secretory pathway pseudopilin PulG